MTRDELESLIWLNAASLTEGLSEHRAEAMDRILDASDAYGLDTYGITADRRVTLANATTKPTPRSPAPGRHGTYAMYKHGCRCTVCATYQSQRNARNRAERLASGRLSHGTRSAYDAGCRCDTCQEARREGYQRLERRVKAS